jgi:hypothetical protein
LELASTPPSERSSLDEAACAELLELVTKLKAAALFHAMATSAGTEDGAFGPGAADVEFQTKSTRHRETLIRRELAEGRGTLARFRLYVVEVGLK